MNHAQIRYLTAKRSVDRRGRSPTVRRALLEALPPAPRIVEAGCGVGGIVPSLLSWDCGPFEYLGVDSDSRLVAFARETLPKELRYRGHEVLDTPEGGRTGGVTFAFEQGDALDRIPDLNAELVVAQAFMDLVPLEPALDAVTTSLAPGGLAYFPITYDGGTFFQPDHPADRAVERAYNAAIDAREGRDARAGRHLLERLRNRDGRLLAVDASDWIVRPQDGTYPADERYFLGRILDFVEEAVDPATANVERRAYTDWIETRRRQLAAGELSYVAHQYDLLHRQPG